MTDEQLAMAGVVVEHHFGGGAYIKQTHIPAGARLTQHKHAHDHLSYLVAGRVVLSIDGQKFPIDAPQCLTLAAGAEHGVEAVTDAIWLCVWSTDCEDPAKVDEAIAKW